MIGRTLTGARALVDSVLVASREPERAVFLAAHDLTLASRVFGWRRVLQVAEPLALPMLAGTTLRAGNAPLTGALAGGTAAQLIRARTPEAANVTAAVAVAAQYLGYAAALDGRNWPGFAVRAGLVAGGLGLSAAKNRRVALATLAGGLPLAWAGASANDPRTATPGTSHGANLLFAAEGLNLLRAALLRGNTLVSAAAVSLSLVGQMLLVDGITRKTR